MRLTMLLLALGLIVNNAEAGDGARVFNRVCATCHGPDARGVPGTYPELHEHVACEARRPGGRAYLAGVLKHGLEGPITVEGDQIEGYMPELTQLSSDDRADVLNYVISLSSRCSESVAPFTAAEVESALSDPKWDSQSLHELREQLLKSMPLSKTDDQGSDAIDTPRAVETSKVQSAKDFTLFCQGCHTPDGRGVPGSVPTLRHNVSLFAGEPEGRAFIVRVPGVAFAPIDDARVANLLNWMLRNLSDTPLPEVFVPYSSTEVAGYRRNPLVDVEAARRHLLAQLPATEH